MDGGEGNGRGPHPVRLLIALAAGGLCWLLGAGLPFPADADPATARRLLFVVGVTTASWLTGAMPIAAASLLPLALLPVLGVQSTEAVARGYADPILWLFGGGFVLAQAVEKWGLHRRLALRVLAAVGANPRRLVLGFFLAATLVSLWINNTSVALMLLPIGTVLVDRTVGLGALSPKAARNFGAGVMCAIAFGASIGGIGTPIGTAPNAVFFANHERIAGPDAQPVSFLLWMLAFAPFALLLTFAASAVVTRIALPVPGGRLPGSETLLQEARELPRWSTAEKRTAILFGVAVLLWVTRGDLVLGGGEIVHGWAWHLAPAGASARYVADGTVAIAVAIASFLIPAGAPARPGERLMDWETARKLPFDLLFLLGGGIALADAFGPTGLSQAFGVLLKEQVTSLPPVLVVLVVVVAITLLSEVASNTAVATLFVPILGAAAKEAAMDPIVLMLPATIGASFGFMLPIATPPNTVVFGSRRITFGQMAKAGLGLDLLAPLLFLPVLWWWVFPILGIAA